FVFDPEPTPMTAVEQKQAQANVDTLNRVLQKDGLPAVQLVTEAPSKNHALAQKIARVFGTKLHFVSGPATFEGVAYRGVAYLKDSMKRPELAIAGHEVMHTLEQTNPELAAKLRTQMQGYLREDAVADRRVREDLLAGKPVSDEHVNSETLADVNGAMWMDPLFWREMRQQDENLFRRVAYAFMEVVTKMVKSLAGTRFDIKSLVTDVEAVRSIIARTWAEHLTGNSNEADDSLKMSRNTNFLQELARHDELFRLPKSDKTTIEGIVADNDPRISVKKLGQVPGEVARYQFTLPDGTTARMVVRQPGSIYGFDTVEGEMHVTDERLPGENPEAAEGKEEVFIDVSLLDPAKGFGAAIYNIAANYAHNTDRIFIGDPAGLSDEAMFRRPQQMLSSALKFGTTEHLAPHPRQVSGDKNLGIPGLKWTHGDDEGNIRNLIDVILQSIDNNGGNGDISYNTSTGKFVDSNGNELSRDDINRMAVATLRGAPHAGGATLARHALFRSLVQGEGGLGGKSNGRSHDVLESLVEQLRQFSTSDSDSPFTKVFYSRTGDAVDSFLGGVGVQENIRQNVSDLFQSEKTFNSWWHKTVGTQYHKAQIDKHFKRVYDAAQRYLTGVSMFANAAADLAPTLLPKLENLRDLTKKRPSKGDTDAAGRAIFEGTLNDKKVYTDAELHSRFNLTDKQIELYREFRAATDKSLDDMGKTDILRYAGKDGAAVTNAVMGAKDVNDAADILAGHLEALGEEGEASVVRDKATRIAQLKQEGYAPLMRFGEHTVYVTGKDGKQLFFGMAETAREAALLAREMREAYPDATVTKGILSKEGHKLFAGISPDTIEVFAATTGLDKSPLFQDYLKLVVNNRSALKRLIERKGVAGFSQDTTRVLASFLTSNARASSKNLYAGEMSQAANDIPKEKGDVRDEAIRLVDYIQHPVEEAAKIRGLLFTNFIGGSLASAAVNMTQPVMMTLPYLSQFSGAAKATKGLLDAIRMAATVKDADIQDKGLRQALARAETEGIVSPQEIHNLQAEAIRSSHGLTIGGKEIVPAFAMRKLAVIWGGFFGLAEQFNRKSTFIAAYQMAKEFTPAQLQKADVKNAYDFAVKAIAETQGVYNRGNRPDWARGALGATLMTFKQYSVAYLEFLARLPAKERALALAILMVAAGANGLPFADDLDDVIDTIGQALGYNFNSKKQKERFLAATLGKGGADFVLHGFSGVGGMPLDVSMRMGLGNLLPGTGLLKKSETDKGSQYAEFGGAAGAFGQKVLQSAGKLLDGDVTGAAKDVAGTAVQNVIKAMDMMDTGAYRDSRGRKVVDADGMDALIKGIGFQPGAVAQEQKQLSMARQDIAMANAVKADIAEKWAQGVFEGDKEATDKARKAIREWNAKNPATPVNVTISQVYRRVREMRMTKADRMVKHAPKSMRAGMKEEMS
ncbi:MAG TPA: PLxRFG domain-containing protein, partial [Noviherbaspirillum sp.]|nr:PLxRFG domain-containing protein [Noviherbaspirillum sp.]